MSSILSSILISMAYFVLANWWYN